MRGSFELLVQFPNLHRKFLSNLLKVLHESQVMVGASGFGTGVEVSTKGTGDASTLDNSTGAILRGILVLPHVVAVVFQVRVNRNGVSVIGNLQDPIGNVVISVLESEAPALALGSNAPGDDLLIQVVESCPLSFGKLYSNDNSAKGSCEGIFHTIRHG
jgi:hypothetical protein